MQHSKKSRNISNFRQVEELSLRLCTEIDLPAVLEIERMSSPSPWKEEFFRQELSNEHSFLWVAEKATVIVGYICVWFIVDEGQILNVAVHPHHRRGGVGNFLMDYAITEARRRHVQRLSLEVRKSNTAALTLYKNFGFQEVSIRKKYYENKEDASLMICRFSP